MAKKKKATPTPTPAPAPAQTGALTMTEEALFGMTDQQVTQAATIAQVITQAVVQAPVVTAAPANQAPSAADVAQVSQQVAAAVAPIIAPELPKDAIKSIADSVATNVVSSPEVRSTAPNVTVTPQVAAKIAEAVIVQTVPQAQEATQAPKSEAPTQTTQQPTTQKLTPTEAKSVESDVVRAISGGEQEDVQRATERVEELTQLQTPVQTQYSSTGELTRAEEQIYGVTVGTGPGEIPPLTTVPTGPAEVGTEPPAGAVTAPVSPISGLQVPTGPTGPAGTGPMGTGPTTGTLGTAGTQPLVQTYTATDGTVFTNFNDYLEYQQFLAGSRRERQSAYDLLYEQFSLYGLGSLVEPLKALISDPSVSPSEFTIKLRQSTPYKTRFAANQSRINKGLRALSEGEYLELEDEYQNVMRRYGLPQSYYTRGDLGRQEGFEKFIEFDVSPVELEERVSTAQNRVTNAAPEVMQSLREFYGDTITNGDVLAYVLNPNQALSEIKRRVTAAEIGAGAAQAGLGTSRMRAEELQRFGITGEQARAGFQQIAGGVQRGGQLAAIYQETPYGQETAEQEIFGITGAPQARQRRQRIIRQEEAAFGGTTGITGGALARERAGQY